MLLSIKALDIKDERHLKSFSGVDWRRYQVLRSTFKEVVEQYQLLQRRPTDKRKRKPGGGRKSNLPSVDDKLIFILHYHKVYPTMDNLGSTFGMSRSSACGLVHLFAGLLKQSLEQLGVAPTRKLATPEQLLKYLKELGDIDKLLIDVTDRPYRRVRNPEQRLPCIVGKKRFTVKNTVMTTVKRWIVFLGLTTQGSIHDYELLKEELH